MKKTLIFIHGGPGFKDYLEEYFRVLQSDFNCLFYDQLRGSDITVESLFKQLDTLIHQQDSPITLIGHSWGGVLATYYASKAPDKITGLVLMSTGLSSIHWYDEYYKELDDLDLNDGTMEDIFLAPDELEIGKAILKFGDKTFCKKTFGSLEPFLKEYNLTQDFKNLDLPILSISGEKDIRFPRRVAQEIKTLNSNIVDIEIKGAGHFPFLKEEGKAQICNAIIKNYK